MRDGTAVAGHPPIALAKAVAHVRERSTNATLPRRLEGTGVTVNALHPGLVATGMGGGGGTLSWFMQRFLRIFGKAPEEGAETLVYLCSSPDVEGVSGKYFVDCKAV